MSQGKLVGTIQLLNVSQAQTFTILMKFFTNQSESGFLQVGKFIIQEATTLPKFYPVFAQNISDIFIVQGNSKRTILPEVFNPYDL